MPINTAKAILFSHQINYREVNGWLQVEDVFTFQGKQFRVWVPCPATRNELMRWIGH